MDEETEREVGRARARLQGAGYPADEMTDEEVLRGRRVWWYREGKWAEVARAFPRFAAAVTAWVASRGSDLPPELEVHLGITSGGVNLPAPQVMLRLPPVNGLARLQGRQFSPYLESGRIEESVEAIVFGAMDRLRADMAWGTGDG
jgi:hypothetical protein